MIQSTSSCPIEKPDILHNIFLRLLPSHNEGGDIKISRQSDWKEMAPLFTTLSDIK